MTLKHRFQVQSSPVSMANPRVRAVARAMLDDPALLERVAYRQIKSFWAGHLCALTFWTCTFGAYEDLFHARYGEENMLGTPEHDLLDFAVKRGSFSPEQELPRWMRRPPSRFFLKLPKDNPFPAVLAKAPDDLTQDDLPFLLLHIAEQAFVSVYHHEGLIRDLALYEAGRWYGLWTQKPNAQIAGAFGVNLSAYLEAVSRAKTIINESDVEPYLRAYALFVRKLGEAMNTKKHLPEDQKAAIIKLFFENKRKYYRLYDDEKQAEAATYYWTAWEIIDKLKLHSPFVRLAIALDDDADYIAELASCCPSLTTA